MRKTLPRLAALALSSLLAFSSVAGDLSAEQKDAASKLTAKGGVVMPIAANTDALAINLATAGKSAGDPELAIVKTLPKVEQLDLRGTSITDAGLANLEGLTTLTTLHLENTAVTDAGLAHLKGLTNLQYLNLYNTAVTDKGLADLAGLKGLKKLYLWQTKTTDAGIATLKKSNADLYVNHGEDMTATTKPAVAAAPADAKKDDAKKPAVKPEEKKPAADAKKDEPKKDDKKPDAAKTAAASEVKPTDAKAINTKCPVSGKDVDPAHTVAYEGKNIGLCCEKCQAKFTADPKKFIDKVVVDAK